LGLAVAFSCLIGEGHAQEPKPVSTNDLPELSLEELVNIRVDSVYAASKYEQKVTQVPASVSIITADEIKKLGHRTLADVLRSVRGLYVSDDRNYSYLGVRGFLRPGDYNTRVLVLVDGHRMNDNVYDGTYVGREGMVDVDLIERVEVIRGPGSSIYGSSAFFGVINVVTKRGQAIGGVEASVEAGSFGSYKSRFSFGKKFKNDVEWLFSGSYYSSEGQERLYYPEFDQRISADPRAANNGVAQGLDGEEAVNLFTSVGYHGLTLSGLFNYRQKQVPTASFGTLFNDGAEETTDYRGYVDLKYDHDFNADLHLQGRIFYDKYAYYGVYPYNYAAPGAPVDRVLFRDGTVGEWAGTEWQFTGKLWDRHTLVLGGEYRENLRQYQFSYDDVQPRFYYLNDNRTSRVAGLYAQGEAVLFTNLVLTAGVRYDHYFEGFGGTLNPRLGLIYNPWKGSAFKVLYGEAFRAPNAYEQFYYRAQPTMPKLQPETIQTSELVYEQYFARNYRLSLSGYYYTGNNLISQTTTPAGSLVFQNVEQAATRGVEIELEGKYESGLVARVSYALQRTEDSLTGAELSSSPRHLLKGNLLVPLYRDKVFVGLELQYQGSDRTLSGRRADDFVVGNLTLFSRELVKGLEMSASVYNLLDTKYGVPGAGDHLQDTIRQDGRSFRLKLTYKF
jgi:outer membrane receptor for ferrienterochelin and colicins